MKPTETTAATQENNTPKKVLIDPSIPIEELLGSVTTYNNVEGSDVKSLQLRTSARVFKKMKLDSALAALPVEKKEPEKKEEIKQDTKKEKPSTRPFWTPDEKNFFFEALNEYGKDFEAIHTYITNKLKKKGFPDAAIKTREQIRHLYYRTWHKISKYLKFSDDVKKLVQEQYGLINYGELRKKLTSVSEKTCAKLNELIYRGSLAIRVKGKTIRIKTPMCRALRRLNQLDEQSDDLKLPNRVQVELKPKDNITWMRVQDLSQNPRVRTVLPLQKRLFSVLTHISERWKSRETQEHEKLLISINTLSPENKEELSLENVKPRTDPPLRFRPPVESAITVPTINLSEYFTAQSICLNAYEERIGVTTSGERLWLEAYPNIRSLIKGSSKRGIKRSRTESNSERLIIHNFNKPSCSTTTDNNENCLAEPDVPINKVDEFIDEAVNTILALQSQESAEQIEEKLDKIESIKSEEDCVVQVKKEEDVTRIKAGWTLMDCGTLTVGDLYLMFGANSKVTLEYSWDDIEQVQCKKEIDATDENQTENKDIIENEIPVNADESTVLSATLKKLLSIAKLHYRKNIVKCPCGHVCGSPHKKDKKITKVNAAENKTDGTQSMSTTIINLQQNNITTANLMPIIIQPQIKKFSPSSLFRRPNSPNNGLIAQLDSIQRLKPRYCNRKGRRPRSKPLVVERKLPLLANKADSGRQIVQMNLLPQDLSVQRQIAPKIVPQIEMTTVGTLVNESEVNTSYVEATLTPVSVTSNERTGAFTIVPLDNGNAGVECVLNNATTSSRVASPTSISNLLDMALRSHENGISIEAKEGATSFTGLISENMATSTPPASPSQILKENENQWLNSEVADFSLSSFLGHLDSPVKTIQTNPSVPNEDTRLCLSQDVDTQLQSLLTENSLDYMAKFADLAAKVNENTK